MRGRIYAKPVPPSPAGRGHFAGRFHIDTKQQRAYLWGTAVHFKNPELQAKIEQWESQTGPPADELVEDVMAGYFDGLTGTREMLDSRYDDIKSGKVKLIPGDVAYSRLMESIEVRHSKK